MLTLAEHALIRKDFLEIWSSKMARATLIAVPIGPGGCGASAFPRGGLPGAVGTSRWNPGDAFAPAFPFTAL